MTAIRLLKAHALAKGAVSYVPGSYSLFRANRGFARAEYFYGVWLKHLTLLDEATNCGVPQSIAELGPGDTIGVGIAALLSGARRYIGVDTKPFASRANNAAMADQLISMFKAREPFHPSGLPDFTHLLDERSFPSRLLSEQKLAESLATERLGELDRSIRAAFNDEPTDMISYCAPMSEEAAVAKNSVDVVISHSVLEHVVDLPELIRSTFMWLRPGGLCSHQFDLRSHNMARTWDGHRAFGDRSWRMVAGARPITINRLPFSRILQCFENAGFDTLRVDRIRGEPTIARESLCSLWRDATDDDLHTEGGYVIARKPL